MLAERVIRPVGFITADVRALKVARYLIFAPSYSLTRLLSAYAVARGSLARALLSSPLSRVVGTLGFRFRRRVCGFWSSG